MGVDHAPPWTDELCGNAPPAAQQSGPRSVSVHEEPPPSGDTREPAPGASSLVGLDPTLLGLASAAPDEWTAYPPIRLR
jgi:hypothetical protein